MAVQVSKVTLDTKELDRLTAQLTPKAEAIISGAAYAVQAQAAQLAPVDTSALANSINAQKMAPFLWRVQDGVEYGVYQELGFIHHTGGQFIQNPFMVPAVEFIRPHFERNWRALFV